MPLDMEIGLIFNMGKVTIQSMARELGFSRNTVSMALKGNETVAPQTREMILRYASGRGIRGYIPQEGIRNPMKTPLTIL